ncbi:MAG: serine/threonine protein kinase, partial [Planctomycetaceae bacterium]
MDTHPRYQPVDKIASGSFATVYRGKDLELGREVAIKQIHEQYLTDPQQLERYWAEAQLLASFQHPNIVTIYDLVRDRGWLIMELMQSDLSKVAGRRPMDVNALRTALAHCLRALKFLHAHGIVHGDVKPSNMMIDRRRRVKLGDFGLARRVSDETGSLIRGTTKYMAPEVVSEEFGEVGPASDLYSLGFAAYELLAGEHFEELFPGLNTSGRDRQMAWMMWHAAPDRRLPEISRVLADVPADLSKTIQKLCAKPQADRYQNADEALSDLNIDLKIVKTGEESSATIRRPEKPVEPGSDPKPRLLLIGAFSLSALASLAMLFMSPGGGSNQASQAPQAGTRDGRGNVDRRALVEDDQRTSERAEG